MSAGYKAVLWNRQKRVYDLTLVAGVLLYLALFVGVSSVARPNATIETLLIRALGTGAFFLLHVVLSIGPLCRLDRRFLPLLYNRRHLGVTTFVLGLGHGVLSLFQFHALSPSHPLVNLLTANGRIDSLAQFPFQLLGAAALVILFLMAATSHDFWLANLTAPVWKRLHMLVYVAYGLLVLHVALGVLQAETSPWLAAALGAGVLWVLTLHVVAGWRERGAFANRRAAVSPAEDGFVEVCGVDDIVENRGRVVSLGGERVAVFRYDGKISALSNVCQHQNGPLGEGRIINGCAVCPWHGYEYLPDTGQSPPPFTEKLPTFRARVERGRVWVHPRPLPAGTRVEPALIEEEKGGDPPALDFYVGYQPRMEAGQAGFVRSRVAAVFVIAAVSALLLALAQRPFDVAEFDFGKTEAFSGEVRLDPYPVMELSAERLLLLGPGKTGADDEVRDFDGEEARVEGTLIRRSGLRALEVVAGSAAAAGTSDRAPDTETALGRHTLRGEIVDSKCYLGVMKPGRAKPHRACAVNCIRGGAPPALAVIDENGTQGFFLLVDEMDGAVNQRVLDLVAEPVEIRGEVFRRGNLHYLRADPATYRRLETGF